MKKLLPLCLILALISLQNFAAQNTQSLFDLSSSSAFSNDEQFLPVDQAFSFNFYQNNNQLDVSFDIAPGYYLYRHQFKFKGVNSRFTSVSLPEGIDHEDEFFGVQKIFTEQLNFSVNLEEVNNNASIKIVYQGCAEKGLCYPPTSKVIQLSELIKTVVDSADSTDNIKKSEQHQLSDMLKQDSLLLTLIAFFVGGLLLSFTPCVFPMYPILTGIIVGQSKSDTPLTTKKAFTLSFFYVQGMAVTYTLLGIVVALAGAKFQAIFQHPAVLISLSVLFIFLALSMFGVFNLALPASWQNKLNALSNQQKGGSITGVLMMGVISGLVASPCTTAPLTGALLYISQTGDVILGASALYH
jgi:thiol:disulfide interchange protein DsbD